MELSYAFILLVVSAFCLSTPLMSAVIPSESKNTISLDGKWRFKMEQVKSPTGPPEDWGAGYPIETPAVFDPFFLTDYSEDEAWNDIDVPGNWEMAGYSPATYNEPDNTSAFYRKWFKAPDSWKGHNIIVNFDGVQNAAEIWLNGKPVKVSEPSWGRENYHESGWTAWQADLTPYIEFGKQNLLALRVIKNTKSANLDSGDYFFLGGIYRPVTLFAVPRTYIQDMSIQTRLLNGGQAEVIIMVDVAGDSIKDSRISVHIEGSKESVVEASDSSGKVELTTVISNARLWSAETPNLYDLRVELEGTDGKTLESVSRRIGIREVSVKDGVLLVNGVPVKLTGICRHDICISTGTVVDEKLWIKDLELMKEANINAIRTSHYPYGSGFYDLCDKMGFYVIDELPYCWCPTDDQDMEPAFLQRARETVIRDKNHPSVIIWAVGNENRPGRNLQSVADLVKKLDPTRPTLVSEMLADKYKTDFDDYHYTVPGTIQKARDDKARRKKWPVIYTENPNTWDVRFGADFGCLDLWGEVLKRTWDVVWSSDGITGSFLWEWQDRAVADKCPTKLYHVDRDTGIQYLKTKGVVDGFRQLRPEYYHLKMVYSPIKVDEDIETDKLPKSVGINITNHYSFTDLSAVKTRWQLISKGKVIKDGVARMKLAPRSSGRVDLAMPDDFTSLYPNTLRADFEAPFGVHVAGYQFELPCGNGSDQQIMSRKLPEGLHFPEFNLVVNETVNDKAVWRKIRRHKGQLVNIVAEPSNTGDFAKLILDQVRNVKANIVLDDDPEVIVGHLEANYADGEFSYSVEWTGEKADIQELGWVFEMPKGYDRFSWKRQALWSVYPNTHIGRSEGTARPDSCNVPLTNVNRPDAHDFDSTKYECNRASLTNKEGKGLQVEFDPDCRHHVRAGVKLGEAYRFVVNKVCSPPRDISSPVVKDLYTVLEKGDRIEGSFRIGSAR